MIIGSPKSIRDTLLNLSQKEDLLFQQVVTRYLHERLLYRLSLSEYKQNFILKGGNLLYALTGLHARPTVDIDMLAEKVVNNMESLKAIFVEVCTIKHDDDCVVFEPSTIKVSEISEEKKHSGIRLLIDARFDTIKQTIQVDIGFDDIITPKPLLLQYPILLEGLEHPDIMAYSLETVIAEKFHAMVVLGTLNSRMKDFYDTYILFKNEDVNDNILKEAIAQTFKQRNTDFAQNIPIFSDDFATDSNRIFQWKHFLKKINADDLEFSVVVKSILGRLQPIYEGLR